MQSNNKVLWLSDSPLTTTGYGTISRNVLNNLSDKNWDCYQLGHNYLGQTLSPPIKFEDGSEVNYKLIGTGMEQYCKDLIMPKLRELKPQIFGILLDTFMLYPWFMELDLAPAKTFFYFPSDGGGQLPQGCENVLRKVDVPIAMAKFGQKQAKELYGIDCEYIPHGVDTKVFYPLTEEEKNNNRLKWGLQGKFVVGTVARNQGRKMLDRTIKAFKEFCKDKPDVILLMHTDPNDRAGVFDLNSLIYQAGIQNRVIFTGMTFYNAFDYKQMNEVYNLMDVFLLTTSGEGFGVPTIEAQACEVPVAVTDYTTTQELVTDHNSGVAIKIAAEITGSWNVERGVMDIDDCTDKLTYLYINPQERKKMGENGLQAVKKYYDWDIVMKQWEELLERMVQ